MHSDMGLWVEAGLLIFTFFVVVPSIVAAIGYAAWKGKPKSFDREMISADEARLELLRIGPLPAVNMLLQAWAAAVGQPAHVTSTVAEITGTPAKTFLQWATDHAREFRA